MDEEHVEPIFLCDFSGFWHEHLDSVAPELVVHPCVLDIPNAVHRQMTRPLNQGHDGSQG